MAVVETLGNLGVNSYVNSGVNKFVSLFRNRNSEINTNAISYVKTRGIIIDKDNLKKNDFSKGFYFQFNPNEIQDSKSNNYEVRPYAGLNYNDYIWGSGGERTISFQLFLDDTPGSHYPIDDKGNSPFMLRDNEVASTIQASRGSEKGSKESTSSWSWTDNGAYKSGRTRIHERGILDNVELIQSFLYPALLDGEIVPKFASGGIISSNQFRPPATIVFALGPLFIEGVLRSAPVTYSLFDKDLTPIRGTIDIEISVFEFEKIDKVDIPDRIIRNS